MDPQEFQQHLQSLQAAGGQQQQQAEEFVEVPPQEGTETADEAVMGAIQSFLGGGAEEAPEAAESDPRYEGTLGAINEALQPPEVLQSAMGGALKSVFETKDFLFGDTPKGGRSAFRADIEDRTAELAEGSLLNGFAAGIGQFATAMIGVGKLGAAAKAIPWVGQAAGAIGATKTGAAALEVGKAALAGAIAFDPHEERLSNLVQDTPLANPVTEWLSADPEDSAAEGRLKTALESIGMDVLVIGTFLGSGKILKHLKKGDTEAASREATRLEEEQRANIEQEQQADAAASPTQPQEPGTPEGGPNAEPAEPAPNATPEAASPEGADPKAQAEAIQEVAVPEQNGFEFRPQGSETGGLFIEDTGEAYAVRMAMLPKEKRGKGLGTQAYKMAIAKAQRDGKAFVSDEQVSAEAAKVYDRLTSEGYVFERNPNAVLEDGVWKAPPDEPVYTLKSAPEQSVEVEVVSTPTQAAQAEGVDLPANKRDTRPKINLSDEDTVEVLKGIDSDIDAIAKHGGWYQAVQAGHVFGKGAGVPYHKFNTDADVDDFVARAVDAKMEELDKLKGGAVLSDEQVDKMVQQRVKLTGEDPAQLLGMIQQAGRLAPQLAANMEVGYALSMKMFQDAYALNARMRLGDFTEFGSKEAMMQEVQKRLSLAVSAYGSARSITANAGRSLRRMRREFMFDPAMFDDINPEQLSDLLDASGANPRSFKHLTTPTVWKQIADFAMYLRINNLVSGPKTQFINMLTSSYLTGVRPLERILGAGARAALGHQPSQQIVVESMKQYTYMGHALYDGFGQAVRAFVRNDSVLSPHNTELWGTGAGIGGRDLQGVARFKKLDSIPNLVHNLLAVAAVPIGLPTRTLGSVDELMKQVVYRSKVMARAHMEVAQQLQGKTMDEAAKKAFVKDYVETRLSNAFDAEGRGVDPEALREAQTATFQQDLLSGTLGKGVQNLTANYGPAKLVLPFVKTPTNVIRYGWKMTPGLNLLQTEYRQMLTGRMGREAQAQASGQMTLGAAFMGAAAYMAANGMITGGGPSDPKVKQELMSTGWRPYSVVRVNEDGTKTFIEYGRYDPVAIPFGMIADIQDAINNIEWDGQAELPAEISTAIGALGIALAKQFTNKSYMLGVSQTMDAMMDPENRGTNAAGSLAASFIPYSAATRQLSGDPYLREARSIADKMAAVTPGLSETIPARYNWLGEPIINRQGLWTSDNATMVDAEVQRLGVEHGAVLTRPNPVHNGVDLRELTLTNGKNAYEEYQRLVGKPTNRATPLRDVVARVMQSEAYQKAPDGDMDVKGTKLWLLAKPVGKYREAAMKRLRKDPKVREAYMTEEQKVRNHYRELRGLPVPPPEKSPLESVGEAFGIDMNN